jgi:predicted DNA-binding transcriptional regulator YafY
MRSPDPVAQLAALQCAVFTDRRLRLEYRSSGDDVARERIVDPYGLVCKAGVWYLVADADGEPRLYRVSRVESAVVLDSAVRRRNGVELPGLWEELRRQVEDRPLPVAVVARVRRSQLDMFCRICAAHLAGPASDDDAEWVMLPLRFAAVKAARILLSFGENVTVLSPPEVRADLAGIAAAVVAQYQTAQYETSNRILGA